MQTSFYENKITLLEALLIVSSGKPTSEASMVSRAGLVLMVILAVETAKIQGAAMNFTTAAAMTNSTTATIPATPTTTFPVEDCPSGWIDTQIYGCFNILETTNLTGAEAMIACEEVGISKQIISYTKKYFSDWRVPSGAQDRGSDGIPDGACPDGG